ncbi:MAG: hypothetical protein JWO38_2410 [Gemmataceae bacterium]|nr:hypothetical protein [Gemmataceae bacterium]
MPRVAGCDPGTSSLDVLVLDDGTAADQTRFDPDQLRADPAAAVRWLRDRGPFDLVAGPSGYGLPLVRADRCTDAQLGLMALVRPDERASATGVAGFSAVARAFRDSGLPVVFLPGVIHLPTVPAHRKLNKIDLGTPDKLCVAALAVDRVADTWTREGPVCVVELGTAFTAAVVVNERGEVVDGAGGTAGAFGWRSGGAWDGEAAYLLSPLRKTDLFEGGAAGVGDEEIRRAAYVESLVKTVAGLCGLHEPTDRFEKVILSGRLFAAEPAFVESLHLTETLAPFARSEYEVVALPLLDGAWVKEAAQGAAVIADGLAGGRFRPVVDGLRLREAAGTVLDWLTHPRAAEVRGWFG